MIKLQELVGVPSLKYHLDNGLSLHENVYRYSSTAFIQLFTEARQAVRDGKIKLNEEDTYLLEYLIKEDLVTSVDDPSLYVYFFHKENTSSEKHLNLIKKLCLHLKIYFL